ncbi:hypothetical protein [Clostridium disporicum]|uniref:hypothetical protein n=1 Tax=Clostridium disporicum TaxID=84024 RepID=UPI0034A5D27E
MFEGQLNMVKVYPLTSKQKKKIFAKIKDYKGTVFNIEYMNECISLNLNLKKWKVSKLLNLELNQCNDCLLVSNHFSWVSENECGKERYFTKGALTYSLDIYDLLSIYFNCSYNQVINYLIDMGYSKVDNKRINDIKIYKENINLVEEVITNYNHINELISKHMEIYVALNDYGTKNSLAFNTYSGESIFFVSTRYLKEQYDLPYSISTINQVINLYTLLGLIYKVPGSEIKNDIYKAYESNPKKAPTNFYCIPSLKMNLENIIENSKILNAKNIRYYDLTKKTALSLSDLNSEINYTKNRGGGDKSKKAKDSKNEKHEIELLFLYYLDREGVVAKEWIKENNNITLKNTAFDKVWKRLVTEHKGEIVKPTNELKAKYQLKTKQDVFISK